MAFCLFFVSFHLFFADFFLDDFVSADGHTDFPSFVFFDAGFSQDNFDHCGLFDRNQVLRVFAPVRIVLDIAFFFAHSVFLDLDFPGAAC